MASLSDYLENQLIDHIFRAGTFTKPTALYFALFTAAPSDSGGGTECSGGSYARVNLAPSNTNWTATQGGTSGASSGNTGHTDNAVAITFPAPTGNWGTAVSVGVFDAPTGGNLLIHGALTTPKTINNGDPAPKFNAGEFDFTLA